MKGGISAAQRTHREIDLAGYSTTMDPDTLSRVNPNVVDPNRPMTPKWGSFSWDVSPEQAEAYMGDYAAGTPASDRGGTSGDVDSSFGLGGGDVDAADNERGGRAGDRGWGRDEGFVDDPGLDDPHAQTPPGPKTKPYSYDPDLDAYQRGDFTKDQVFDASPTTSEDFQGVTNPTDPSWDFHFADLGAGPGDPGGKGFDTDTSPGGPDTSEAGRSDPGGGGDDGSGLGHGGGGGLGGGEGGEGDVGSGDSGGDGDTDAGESDSDQGGDRGDGDGEGFW
jgi:hypothetical protein